MNKEKKWMLISAASTVGIIILVHLLKLRFEPDEFNFNNSNYNISKPL